MRKINKKILVAALSLMLVACAFVTILSFTMAASDDGDGAKTVDANTLSLDVVTFYNIDRIIQNSIDGSDPMFRIVEVSSSSADSAMGSKTELVERMSNVFTEYVFNGHATIEEKMAEGKIDYQKFSTSSMSDTQIQSCVDALAKADLIYVHNDASNYFGKNDNDIPEMIKLQLCSAAVGSYVPFIIDGPISTQEIISNDSTSYQILATKVFKKYGSRYNTYGWSPSTQGTALEYFTHQTSVYVQIDGNSQRDKRTKVYGIEDFDKNNLPTTDPSASPSDAEKIDTTKDYVKVANDPATVGRILVINNTAADGDIAKLIKNSITEYTGACILEEDTFKKVDGVVTSEAAYKTVKDKDGNDVKLMEKVVEGEKQTAPPIYNTGNVKLYSVPSSSGLYSAYITRNAHPNYMSFEYYASDDAALNDIDYSLYDLVIVESGASLKTLSQTNYEHLVSKMYSGQHILYNTALVDTSATNTITVVNYGENYDYVCGKVMTSTESAKYSNILVTNKTRMDAYMSANNSDAVDDIANIINYASYRGIGGGNDDASNTYTVLEIQPSYPIDEDLAKLFAKIDGTTHIRTLKDPLEKNAYDGVKSSTNPDGANHQDMTFDDITGRVKPMYQNGGQNEGYKNEITSSWYYLRNQGVINNTTSDEISFDGENSLTSFLESGSNISSKQLAMVTDYYAWTLSKAKIAHATGLDYNQVNVVHMSTYEFNCSKKTLLDNFDAVYIGGDNSGIKTTASFNQSKLSSIGRDIYNMYFTEGDAYEYSQNYGKSDGSVGTLEGNDISNVKYQELKAYKTKGMPVIIGKDAVSGLTESNAIDPDSNMYAFLNECKDGSSNVLWNFDFEDTVKIANGGKYGDTYGGYVTVFAGTATVDYLGQDVKNDTSKINEEDLIQCLDNSKKRPKLVVSSAPIQYKEGDEKTWISDHTLQWNYEAAGGSKFEARLIFDDNANSRFDDDKVVSKFGNLNDSAADIAKKGTLSKTMDPDFYGVIYWKLEVENESGLKASTTGCIKIKREDQEKIEVNLLQIMPDDDQIGGDNSHVSLYLCTECQQSRFVIYGNRHNKDKYGDDCILKLSDGFTDGTTGDGGWTQVGSVSTPVNNIKRYITNAQNDDHELYVEGMPDYNPPSKYTVGMTNYAGSEFGFNVPNNLGVHQHKFGIVKYDSDLTSDSGNWKGIDNWNTNWFRDVENDFDVDMNIIYLSEFEGLVNSVEASYAGKSTAEIETRRSQYKILASEFQNAYNGMVKVINNHVDDLTSDEKSAIQKYLFRQDAIGLGVVVSETEINSIKSAVEAEANAITPALTGAEKTKWINEEVQKRINEKMFANFDEVLSVYAASGGKLETYLKGFVSSGTNFDNKSSADIIKKEVEYELSFDTYDERPYYDILSLVASSVSELNAYAAEYANWRDAKIYEQFFRKMYEYFSFYAAVNDSGEMDLTKVYNCIVFGAAEDFAGGDLAKEGTIFEDNYTSIDAIIRYINNGGQTMLFYDSLTSNSTVNMTKKLGPYFGVNAASAQETVVIDEAAVEYLSDDIYEGVIHFKIGDKDYSTWDGANILKPFNIDTAASEVNIVFSNVDGNNSNFTIDVTDNATSNKDNPDCYKQHNIKVNVTVTNPNKYTGSKGATFYIEGANIGNYGVGVTDGTVKTTFTIPSSIYTATNVIEELGSGSGAGGGGSANPSKLTYATALGQSDAGTKPMTKYSLYWPELEAEKKTHPRKDMAEFALNNRVATNTADQNNEGIVTMYPFSIGSNLRVTPTVEGDFTIKANDPNLIVYYSLSGGTSGTMSTNYVANPHDGGNNYFVYQYQPKGNNGGMVTYLGAGRTVITGYKRENNDERRFFINLILNTGRKSTASTTLDIYDHSSTQVVTSDGTVQTTNTSNATVVPNGTRGYKMEITEGKLPEFSMMVTSDVSVDISEVWVYYDLDYKPEDPDDAYHEGDKKHILVYNKTYNTDGNYNDVKYTEDPWVASGYLMYVDADTALKSSTATVFVDGVEQPQSMLDVKNSYLEPYGNEYTYLVVKVQPTKGNAIYRRIKIIIKPELHDLT